MSPTLLNANKIQNGTRKLALLISDSTFITARKIRETAKTMFRPDDAKAKQEFIAQLVSLLQSESPTVRLAVVEALARVHDSQARTTRVIRSSLGTALADSDENVRAAAAAALKK